jgi:hypothetical protein
MQPPARPADPPRAGGSSASYIAIGCGLILLLACCMSGVAGGIYWMLKSKEPPEATGRGDDVTTGSVVVSGVVTSASGLAGVAPGTPCSFTVDKRESGMCRASVLCGGTTLYGSSAQNGFFPCTSFSTSPPTVVGADTSTTQSDSDPAFSIDTNLGAFSVSDDGSGALGAFTVSARISSVN